jgi:hypothetical protein
VPSAKELAELARLGRGDDGPEVQLGQRVVRLLDRQRVPEAQRVQDRQVHVQERGEQPSLHDIAGICGAALLRVLETLAQMLGEHIPLTEVPDAPRVQALLLEEVPALRVGKRDSRLAAGRAAAHERKCTDALAADERFAERRTVPGNERHREAGAGHQRVREGQAMKAALRGCLGHDRVAGQRLHQLGVHLHAHRVVPAGDVRHRTRQGPPLVGCAGRELSVDLRDVPAHPVESSVDIGARQPPWFADLPTQQQREQVPVPRHGIDGLGDSVASLVEVDLAPGLVLLTGLPHGIDRLVEAHARGSRDGRAIHGIDVVARPSHAAPLTADEVPQAIGVERLWRRRTALRVRLPP